jgi:predicted ester cyclase
MNSHEQIQQLAQREIDLRGATDENGRNVWCDAVKALRKAVPDWSATVVELIAENSRLTAQLEQTEGTQKRGQGAKG